MNSQTIGIIGGGQLGRMLTLAAKPLGFNTIVLDPGENCPARQVGAVQVVGQLSDEAALKQLFEASDFVTAEIEHFDIAALAKIKNVDKKFNPSRSTFKIIQDKYQQKKIFAEAGIPVVDFAEPSSLVEAVEFSSKHKFAVIMKAKKGAYDGRGNVVIDSEEELIKFDKENTLSDYYIEHRIRFKKELSVIVARSISGEVKSYPLTETVHKRSICLETYTPASVSKLIQSQAVEIAVDTVSRLDGAGVFGVEMFLSSDDEILLNEVAPRVHNSGHYTMDACATGQFEQQIRAISGLPLGSTELLAPAVTMINILGECNGETVAEGLYDSLAVDGASVHLYGKSPTKIDRKMGHINVIGDKIEATRQAARQARKSLEV